MPLAENLCVVQVPRTPRLSPKEQAQFVRAHDAVMIVRLIDGRLEVVPWQHVRGGFKAMSSASIVVDPPQPGDAVAAAIRAAFERAA